MGPTVKLSRPVLTAQERRLCGSTADSNDQYCELACYFLVLAKLGATLPRFIFHCFFRRSCARLEGCVNCSIKTDICSGVTKEVSTEGKHFACTLCRL